MLDFLNEVLMIDDLEPDAYQMGISGKSGAKMKAPDGGKASMKGDFNALHPRYPKGHPQGGKFMPKGSKDQINAVAKAKGVSTEQAAAMVGGKAPANKGKLGKFSGSAGAVGKAQKVLKNKDATPEQRAKAKASIQKAAMKMRGEAPVVAEKPKRGKISNKEIMARNAGTSASVPSGSMSQGDQRIQRKKELTSKAVVKGSKVAFNVLQSQTARDKNFGGTRKSTEKAINKSIARNAKKKEKNAVKENKTELMRRNMAGADPVAEKPKRGRISNKEIMARNAGKSAPVATGSMTKGAKKEGAKAPTGSISKNTKFTGRINDPEYRQGRAGTSLNIRNQILNNIAESKRARESSVSQYKKRASGLGVALSPRENALLKINKKRERKGLPPLKAIAAPTTKAASKAAGKTAKRVKSNLAISKSARTEKLSESQRQRMAEKANKKRMSKGSKPKKESFKISKEDEDFLNSL